MTTFKLTLGHHHQQHCHNFWQKHCLCILVSSQHHYKYNRSSSSSPNCLANTWTDSSTRSRNSCLCHRLQPTSALSDPADNSEWAQRVWIEMPPTNPTTLDPGPASTQTLSKDKRPAASVGVYLLHLFEWCSPTCCSTASAASHTLSQCSPAPENEACSLFPNSYNCT